MLRSRRGALDHGRLAGVFGAGSSPGSSPYCCLHGTDDVVEASICTALGGTCSGVPIEAGTTLLDTDASGTGASDDGGSPYSPQLCANGIGQCLDYSTGLSSAVARSRAPVCEQLIIGGEGCGAERYCCVVAP